MTQKPRLLILMFTPLETEPRAYRQVRHFSKDYDVVTVGYGTPPFPNVRHIAIPDSIPEAVLIRKAYYALYLIAYRFGWYRLAYWFSALHRWAWSTLSLEQWDVVIAHDVRTVPLANRLKPKFGVLVDLHEYAPRQHDHLSEWMRTVAPYFRWICKNEVPKAAAVVTVGQGISEEYEKQFGFSSEVVTNATSYADVGPGRVASPIRIVHSGSAVRSRGLEVMIEAVLRTSADVTLDLYFIPPDDPEYYQSLLDLAGNSSRITFRDAVPYTELVGTLNNYDVGLSVIAPTAFNHLWALPNKFFDFIQARLAVGVGPSPEMARIVDEYDLGFVADGFGADAVATKLDGLTPERVAQWKRASHRHAAELSGERQVEVLDRVVRRLLQTPVR